MCKFDLKKIVSSIVFGIVLIIVLSSSNLNAQCSMMKSHGSHSGHEMKSEDSGDTTLIRKGIIDVDSLDINLDGYVYQDQMDWNVISDKAGTCPVCGMELKKVKNSEAKKNLKDHSFEVK
jgi:hypothetical protein